MSPRKLISNLLRKEFDATEWYNEEKINELINTARSYGLEELAEEMENDLV